MHAIDLVVTAAPPAHAESVTNGAGRRLLVMSLQEFARRMPHVQPPCAYRLSLDSGVEFNNVKHAFEQPLAVRLDTWLRLLRSLGACLVAACSAEDVGSEDPGVPRVRVGLSETPESLHLSMSLQSSLQECRRARAMSMATLAQTIGVSIDTVTSVERGRGLLRNVARVCEQYGLKLYVAMPGRFSSVEELWAEHAERYLIAPSQFPPRRPTRKFDMPPPSDATDAPPKRRSGPPRKPRG